MRTQPQRDEESKANQIPSPQIGTLSEKGLHAALKNWYAKPGDRLEEVVDGFHIDIVRRNLLIEIQTSNFSSVKSKLASLTQDHVVRLVYPIALEKRIVKMAPDGTTIQSSRKSPKRGQIFQLFKELVSIPELVRHQNFSLELLLIKKEEVRLKDGYGSWKRKGWSIFDHRLIEVVVTYFFDAPSDFLTLLPSELPEPFSTSDLAEGIGQPRWLAQKMAYCLRNMGAIGIVGKIGNSLLYAAAKNTSPEQAKSEKL
jgi:hypothetical protein